MFPCKTRALNN